MTKISLIGAGNLGASIGYEIASRNLTNELVLVDIAKELCCGQAMDIQQALPFKNKTKVYDGQYSDIANSDIIVITAGKPRTPDMTDRLQLAKINIKIMDSVLKEIKEHSPNSIIITISNPLDIINHHIHKFGFDRHKVIGSSSQLDSARFRTILGHPDKEVEAFVIGEHGNDQVPVFSKVKIDNELKEFTGEEKQSLKEQVKYSSLCVIEKKGCTVFAPTSNTVDLVEAIVKDQSKLVVCSVNLENDYYCSNVSLGVPVILGKEGVKEVVKWDLAAEELEQFRFAAKKLQDFYQELTKHI